MAKLVALYKMPENVEAFDSYYFSTHVPLAKKMPGLLRYEVSAGPVATPQGGSAVHLAAILSFHSLSTIRRALDSPQGRTAGADLANFAQAGVELLVFDSKDV
ncbi:MAG TPA: EthD family reductase [Burkholderiales bacterium]|nr:EthD family reductase [Burkholderiales bacterium]